MRAISTRSQLIDCCIPSALRQALHPAPRPISAGKIPAVNCAVISPEDTICPL